MRSLRRSSGFWLSVLVAWCVLAFLLFLVSLPLHAQRVTVRTPKGIAHVADSLVTASRARAHADSVRRDSVQREFRDSVRRALRPAERYAQVDGTTVGYLLRRVDGAPLMSDSQYTADTTAIVRRLWPRWAFRPGKAALVVPGALVAGSLDRHTPDGAPLQWTGNDKVAHAFGGMAVALVLDDGRSTGSAVRASAWGCVAAAVFELGQMRPSRWPAAGPNTLGVGDYHDAAVGCGGAIVGPLARRMWGRLR